MTNNKARDHQQIDFMFNQFLQEMFMVLSHLYFILKYKFILVINGFKNEVTYDILLVP